MKWWSGALACACALGLASASRSAAEPPPASHSLERKLEAARDQLKAAKEEAKDKLRSAAQDVGLHGKQAARELRGAAEDVRDHGQAALKEAGQALAQAGDHLKSALEDVKSVGDRGVRVKAARRSAWQRFATHARRPSDIPPSARVELRIHARRMARLERIRALAEYEHDQASVRRADALVQREQARHEAALAMAWPALLDPKARVEDEDEAQGRPREDEEDPEPEP